jgi:hypothetical protein
MQPVVKKSLWKRVIVDKVLHAQFEGTDLLHFAVPESRIQFSMVGQVTVNEYLAMSIAAQEFNRISVFYTSVFTLAIAVFATLIMAFWKPALSLQVNSIFALVVVITLPIGLLTLAEYRWMSRNERKDTENLPESKAHEL